MTNLVNRLSLDQTYYTIRKAGLFVTGQNGLSVLAGATDTRIVVLPIKPSVAREKLLGETRAANAMLRDDARRDGHVTYVDTFTPMLGRDGRPRRELFGGDGLHMNSAGYALWRATLQPVLDAR